MHTRDSSLSNSTDVRNLRSRGSYDVQTGQSQPMMGTP